MLWRCMYRNIRHAGPKYPYTSQGSLNTVCLALPNPARRHTLARWLGEIYQARRRHRNRRGDHHELRDRLKPVGALELIDGTAHSPAP